MYISYQYRASNINQTRSPKIVHIGEKQVWVFYNAKRLLQYFALFVVVRSKQADSSYIKAN